MSARDFRDRVRKREAVKKAQAALEKQEVQAIKQAASDQKSHKLLLVAIDNECKQISSLPKGSVRTDKKRQLLKTFLPVIDEYIESGEQFANVALTQVLIWLFDCGDISNAMRVARVAIEQNQPMPKRFGRDIKTFVADAFLEWAKAERAGNDKAAIGPYFTELFDQVLDWPVHDPIKIQYLKLAAEEAERDDRLESALDYLLQAEKIDPVTAKVKTRKEKLAKAIAAAKEAPPRAVVTASPAIPKRIRRAKPDPPPAFFSRRSTGYRLTPPATCRCGVPADAGGK